MFDVLDEHVLMREPVVHLLLDVGAVLVKLGPRARLEVLDPLVLALDLVRDALVQLRLPRQPLLLLHLQRLLDLRRLLVQRVKDLPLLLNSRVSLRVDALLDASQVRSDRVQLVLQRLDAVVTLLL